MKQNSLLPNFIIAGTNKAGTTSLFQYLKDHPQVCNSRDKETGYFLPFRYGKQAEPIEKYTEQFADYKGEKIIMEATPGYFYGGLPLANALQNTVQQNCKILIILREPVSRLISFYKAKKKSLELDKNLDFNFYVNACLNLPESEIKKRENNKMTGISSGYYVEYLDDWMNVFKNNLKITFFDDLHSDPKKFMIVLCNWLEIDAGYFKDFNFEIENKTYQYKSKVIQKMAVTVNIEAARFWRKNPEMKKWIRRQYLKINQSDEQEMLDQETLNFVTSLFKPYNLRLKQFLISNGFNNLPKWLSN
jgi:hypothetical protein